ncbi:hypothetical protein F01_420583 [Burkholderia cenocepacia]|nr:hypothetical protein F01_420583 [Burkholderia cenocepacia]
MISCRPLVQETCIAMRDRRAENRAERSAGWKEDAVRRMAGAGMTQSTCLCGAKTGERRWRGAGSAHAPGWRRAREDVGSVGADRAIGAVVKRERRARGARRQRFTSRAG